MEPTRETWLEARALQGQGRNGQDAHGYALSINETSYHIETTADAMPSRNSWHTYSLDVVFGRPAGSRGLPRSRPNRL